MIMESAKGQNQASASVNQPIALQKCISIFKNAKTDNERFAGLVLVTQLVQSNTLNPADRRKLFDAVGFTFINRLLGTKEVPQGCPDNVFQALAMTILACFSTDGELLFHPQMVAKVPLIGEVILNTPDEGAILDDCYHILVSFAASGEGCECLVRHGCVKTLCRVVLEGTSKRALDVLLRILHFCPKEGWVSGGRDLVNVLSSLSKTFATAQDASKFELCKTLLSFLSSIDSCSLENILEEAGLPNDWQADLCWGLQDILQSKVSAEQRDPALILTALLIDLVGIRSLLVQRRPSSLQQNPAEDVKSPELIVIAVTLAGVEIKMILENSASKEEILKKQSLLSSCYGIIEKTISFTVSEAPLLEDKEELAGLTASPKANVSRVYGVMKEAVESIMGFLNRASSHQDEMGSFSGDERNILTASVRVVGAWIAEETSALQVEVRTLLPFLLRLGKGALQSGLSVNAASSRPEGDSGAGEELAGDLTDLWLGDNKPSQPIILRFLLPGLCHLSSDETALQVLIDNQAHTLLWRYFSIEWEKWINHMDDIDARTTLMTLVGIFLNFAVMKPNLVARDKVFQDLCQLVSSSVPDLISRPEHICLAANLVVLSLMLLRHQHVAKEAMHQKPLSRDMQGYFHAVVHLLRSGVQTQLKDGQGATHEPSQLAFAYDAHWDDISELWFLGVQLLTSLLAPFAVLRQVVKDSGWCEELNNKSTINQSAEVREALSQFLKEFEGLQV